MTMKQKLISTLLPLIVVLATPVVAEDQMKLELSVIRGNRELPKVLYIMPWKRLPSKDIEQKLILHSLFEDVFEPIEPESFEQHIENYYHFTQQSSNK